MNFKKLIICIVFLAMTVAAYSHGTKYEIVKSGRIGIKAMYDTGEAMSDADVLIFPPDATTSSSKEKSDSQGVFYFTPDKAGTWILQVRDRSGHGMRINLQIDESLSLKGEGRGGAGLNIAQKILMVICVIWGAAGTALYFKGKQGQI